MADNEVEIPVYTPFFGVMGATSAMVFSAFGAAYGTAKSGTGIAAMSVMRPDLIMKSIIPVVMAGIIAIYGLVVAVLITGNLEDKDYTMFQSFVHLGAGLSVGLSGLAAGFAIGIVGDAGVRGTAQQPKTICGNDLNSNFCRSLGSIWVNYCPDHVRKGWRLSNTYIPNLEYHHHMYTKQYNTSITRTKKWNDYKSMILTLLYSHFYLLIVSIC